MHCNLHVRRKGWVIGVSFCWLEFKMFLGGFGDVGERTS